MSAVDDDHPELSQEISNEEHDNVDNIESKQELEYEKPQDWKEQSIPVKKLSDNHLFEMVAEEDSAEPSLNAIKANNIEHSEGDDEPDVPSSHLVEGTGELNKSGDGDTTADHPSSGDLANGSNSRRSSLLRTTAARENERAAWENQLEEKKLAAMPKLVKRQDPNYVPNERLMKPTQSRLNERKDWEEHLKNKEYEDDIWWEKRRPNGLISKTNDSYNKAHKVSSRLTEPTVAALQSKREKFPMKKDDPQRPVSPSRDVNVAKIDATSPLLKGTCASYYQQVDKEGHLLYAPEPSPNSPIVLEAKYSGPSVTSKLYKNTAAYENSKWVAPEPDSTKRSPRKSSGPSSTAAVGSPSPRLLEFNASMKAQRREKSTKTEGDKREAGWDSFHWKEKIPKEIKPLSPNSSFTKRSSSNSSNASASSVGKIEHVHSDDNVPEHVFDRLTEQLQLNDSNVQSETVATPAKIISESSDIARVPLQEETRQQSEQQECKEDCKSATVAEAEVDGSFEVEAKVDEDDDDEEEDNNANNSNNNNSSGSKHSKKKNKRNKKAQ